MPTAYNDHIRCLTHTSYRAINSGAVATCFKDKDLSKLGIKPRSLAWEAIGIPLSHRGGEYVINGYQIYRLVLFISVHFQPETEMFKQAET